MNKFRKIKKRTDRFLFDHPVLKFIFEYAWALLLCLFSSSIFAFGFSAFITPGDPSGLTIITGGASGSAQIIALIFAMAGVTLSHSVIVAIAFVGINLPLIIFAFKYIGVRFASLTCLNVLLTAIFMTQFDPATVEWVNKIATSDFIKNQTLVRVLFGGICTGLSSSSAFIGFFSAGGIDIVSYYFALQKSTSVGKYALFINSGIIVIFTALGIIGTLTGNPNVSLEWVDYLLGFLFAFIYLAVVSFVVDKINVRNKKVRIDIVTNDESLSGILIANFPHGITITKGIGGYSRNEKYILSMAISSSEVKRMVELIKKSDPYAFIQVTNLNQIYGKFFINPIR